MKSFDIPKSLNGAELVDELLDAGISLPKEIGFHRNVVVPRIEDGKLWLDISNADEAKATEIVAKHNGTTISPEPTVAEKLASVGLNLDDLKAALGL